MRIEILERIKTLRTDIEKCAERETTFRSAAEQMTRILSEMPKTATPSYSRVEEYAVKLTQTQEYRQRLEIELLIEQTKLVELITNAIDDKNVRQLIRSRYIESQPWRNIAAELHYSLRQVLRLNQKALQSLNAVIAAASIPLSTAAPSPPSTHVT